jgi:hypothetical protein
MPLLTRWFIKAALIYLVLALCVGILLVLPMDVPASSIFPSYLHMLTFGWLTQLIFGVALWMFPKFSIAQPRGLEWLGWTAFVSLNAGLILRIIFEPLHSLSPSIFNSWMLILAALLQWLAGVCFVLNTWNRVREK